MQFLLEGSLKIALTVTIKFIELKKITERGPAQRNVKIGRFLKNDNGVRGFLLIWFQRFAWSMYVTIYNLHNNWYIPVTYLHMYFAGLGVCLFVLSNKRQKNWSDRAQILYVTLHVPREGLWMIKNSKISLQQNLNDISQLCAYR